MTKLLVSAAAVLMMFSPALAQQGSKQPAQQERATSGQQAPRLFNGQGVTNGNAVYDCTGKYLGSDPDPKVRAQMMRQGSTEDAACK